jgi:hypothetical protein
MDNYYEDYVRTHRREPPYEELREHVRLLKERQREQEQRRTGGMGAKAGEAVVAGGPQGDCRTRTRGQDLPSSEGRRPLLWLRGSERPRLLLLPSEHPRTPPEDGAGPGARPAPSPLHHESPSNCGPRPATSGRSMRHKLTPVRRQRGFHARRARGKERRRVLRIAARWWCGPGRRIPSTCDSRAVRA